MASKASKLTYKEESSFPWINTNDIPKWLILVKIHMTGKRVWEVVEEDKPPDYSEMTYNTLLNSREPAAASAYRTICKKRTSRWERKNVLALEILVKITYHNARAQTVAVGNPGTTAKDFLDRLIRSL